MLGKKPFGYIENKNARSPICEIILICLWDFFGELFLILKVLKYNVFLESAVKLFVEFYSILLYNGYVNEKTTSRKGS